MGAVYVIQGILIYIYAFDHNPPHIHVRSGRYFYDYYQRQNRRRTC
ncbi:DUF4160 domain-containing protein [Prevotella copri]|nr:DUF4160 domain-containing protein [Segatella copri]MCW4080473.1 DUF4160 domain-containing protein [Segatella copri]